MSRSALSGATVLDCGARKAPKSVVIHLVPLVVWVMGLGLNGARLVLTLCHTGGAKKLHSHREAPQAYRELPASCMGWGQVFNELGQRASPST